MTISLLTIILHFTPPSTSLPQAVDKKIIGLVSYTEAVFLLGNSLSPVSTSALTVPLDDMVSFFLVSMPYLTQSHRPNTIL